MKFQRILTIVDKPKHPQVALARTARLLKETGGSAHLAAFCFDPALEHGQVMTGAQARAGRRTMVDERRLWLQGEAARYPQFEHAERSVVWARDIADAVDEIVEAQPTDLLLKTLHQSRTLIHTPLDWDLLRRSKVPVLLATSRRRKKSGIVLATIDPFSTDRAHQRLNRRVLDAAFTIAELEGAVVHVVVALNLGPVLTDLDLVDKRALQRRLRERAEAGLADLLRPYDLPRSRTHMQSAKVGEAVDRQARLLHADLVVVGTCAHPVKQLLGLGNSAEKIVARLQTDILAVCA